jgi:Ni,Fe-hydrogenase I cytochrome b subunit
MDKKRFRAALERELRFAVFEEKEPVHRIVHSPEIAIAMMAVFVPTVYLLGFYGIIMLARFNFLEVGGFYLAILMAVLEGFHYLCDRPSRKEDVQKESVNNPENWKRGLSGREKAESAVAS